MLFICSLSSLPPHPRTSPSPRTSNNIPTPSTLSLLLHTHTHTPIHHDALTNREYQENNHPSDNPPKSLVVLLLWCPQHCHHPAPHSLLPFILHLPPRKCLPTTTRLLAARPPIHLTPRHRRLVSRLQPPWCPHRHQDPRQHSCARCSRIGGQDPRLLVINPRPQQQRHCCFPRL